MTENQQRYLNDPYFHVLVDSLEQILQQARPMPSDFGRALNLALDHYVEHLTVGPFEEKDKEIAALERGKESK